MTASDTTQAALSTEASEEDQLDTEQPSHESSSAPTHYVRREVIWPGTKERMSVLMPDPQGTKRDETADD